MVKPIQQHCLEIERCNQRGGRMLSIVDLLHAKTLSQELAAYLLAAIHHGASFMVGALPGGAGKTTVMGALLNFVPADVLLQAADGSAAIKEGLAEKKRRCYICHEIGPGDYFAYLWGERLRNYFKLLQAGHILATNLHADTFQQAFDQVCRDNRVPEALFRRMNLLLFLRVQGGWSGRREIVQIWESPGDAAHELVFEKNKLGLKRSRIVKPEQVAKAAYAIEQLLASDTRTSEEVRQSLLTTLKAA